MPDAIEVVEDGDSFAANAALKAAKQAIHLKRWVLADDSGLEVDALGGEPGIYSARFAGPNATDDDNNRRLLDELGSLPLERRTAQYVCHVTVADPTGAVRAESHDICRGRIRFAAAGTNGFGYDPLLRVGRIPPHFRRAWADCEADAQPPFAGAACHPAAADGAKVAGTLRVPSQAACSFSHTAGMVGTERSRMRLRHAERACSCLHATIKEPGWHR